MNKLNNEKSTTKLIVVWHQNISLNFKLYIPNFRVNYFFNHIILNQHKNTTQPTICENSIKIYPF